jgi:hypothetical protein
LLCDFAKSGSILSCTEGNKQTEYWKSPWIRWAISWTFQKCSRWIHTNPSWRHQPNLSGKCHMVLSHLNSLWKYSFQPCSSSSCSFTSVPLKISVSVVVHEFCRWFQRDSRGFKSIKTSVLRMEAR